MLTLMIDWFSFWYFSVDKTQWISRYASTFQDKFTKMTVRRDKNVFENMALISQEELVNS